MTTDPPTRRLRLGAVVLALCEVAPPRLYRVLAVEAGDDAAAEVLLVGCVVTEASLRAAVAGRLSVLQLAARAWRV